MIDSRTSFYYEVKGNKIDFKDERASEFVKDVLKKQGCDVEEGIMKDDLEKHKDKCAVLILLAHEKDARIASSDVFSSSDFECLSNIIDELGSVFRVRCIGAMMEFNGVEMVIIQQPYTMNEKELEEALERSALHKGEDVRKPGRRQLRKSREELGMPCVYMQVMNKRLEHRFSDKSSSKTEGRQCKTECSSQAGGSQDKRQKWNRQGTRNGDRGPIWRGRIKWRYLEPKYLPMCLAEELLEKVLNECKKLGINARLHDWSEPEYVCRRGIGSEQFLKSLIRTEYVKDIRIVDYPIVGRLLKEDEREKVELLPSLMEVADDFFLNSYSKLPGTLGGSAMLIKGMAYIPLRLLLFFIDGRYRMYRSSDAEIERRAMARMKAMQSEIDEGKIPEELINLLKLKAYKHGSKN